MAALRQNRSVNGQTAITVSSTSTTPLGDALPSTSNRLQVSKSTPIVFGGEGTLPGQIDKPYGVAVSADNEIFVADMNNKRVQVFSMNGTFLRLFPPEVPGGNDQAMYPTDVDIDEQGRVWVVGKDRVNSFAVRVVQYGTDGLLVTTFVVKRFDWYPKIAVNSRYNRIIVLACNELFKFKPDGSFDGSFGKKEGPKLQYVTCTSDRDGNILVTDISIPGVKVYDHNGQRLFSFRTVSVGKGKPRGICMDPQGHIMVADSGNGRVDMFTSRGKFVRTVVNVTNPWDIALGPGGQLVVTDVSNYTVTIFPRWMVFPDE
ncbi:E3 ubiquitin-protein ligase TRIM32-like [Branchiostoma floridae x Branchiostoma belcheri]